MTTRSLSRGVIALTLAAACLGWSAPALAQDGADEVRWRGPMRVRTQFPLDLITLDQTPEAATLGAKGSWSLEVGVTHSNTFEITDDYDKRVADFAGGTFRSGWDFNVDDETTRLHARLDWAVTEHVEVGVEVPFLSHDEGFMDSIIDDFHETLSLLTNNRESKPQDVLNVDFISGDDRFRLTEPGAEIGDITLHAKIALYRGARTHVATLLEAKAPTGDEAAFTGSGEWDYGLGLLVSAGGVRHVFHGGLSQYFLGDAIWLPFEIEDRTAAFLGYEWAANERWSVVAQVLAATSILPDDPVNKNDGERVDIEVGAHYGRNQWQVTFGFIEGLTTNDNSSDLAVFLATTWRM